MRKLEPSISHYNMSNTFPMSGDLNPSYLEIRPKVPSVLRGVLHMPGHMCELAQISNSGLSVTQKCLWPWPWASHILGAVSIVVACRQLTVYQAPGKPAHVVGPLHILEHLGCTCAGEHPTASGSWRNGDVDEIPAANLGHKTMVGCRQKQFLFLNLSFVFFFPKSTMFYLLKGTISVLALWFSKSDIGLGVLTNAFCAWFEAGGSLNNFFGILKYFKFCIIFASYKNNKCFNTFQLS